MTNKIQHYTIFFIAVIVLHVSGSISAHYQGSKFKTVHTASGMLPLPLAWVRRNNSPTLAVAANMLNTYQMPCVLVQFEILSPDDGRRYRPKHVEQ
jgi:hypothetical protein